MRKCKITVLKAMFYKELADQYIPFPDFGPCHMMKQGDTFITSGPFGMDIPEGFCFGAWDAIGKIAAIIASGGKVFGTSEDNVACCNDGVRPVIFLLEPFEDDTVPQI